MKKLVNPLSKNYLELKKIILGGSLPWFLHSEMVPLGPIVQEVDCDYEFDNLPFMGHRILGDPGYSQYKIPEKSSELLDISCKVVAEVAERNSLSIRMMCRIGVNMTFPSDRPKVCLPHVDHAWPHKNLIIYFTDAGGETILYTKGKPEEFTPKEDDVLLLEGVHSARLPIKKNRIILVATFIGE